MRTERTDPLDRIGEYIPYQEVSSQVRRRADQLPAPAPLSRRETAQLVAGTLKVLGVSGGVVATVVFWSVAKIVLGCGLLVLVALIILFYHRPDPGLPSAPRRRDGEPPAWLVDDMERRSHLPATPRGGGSCAPRGGLRRRITIITKTIIEEW